MSILYKTIKNNKSHNFCICDKCKENFIRRADNKNTAYCKSCTNSIARVGKLKKLPPTISGLIVIQDLGMNRELSKPKREAIFKCSCGNDFKAIVNAVKTKQKMSCGCKRGPSNKTHNLSSHPLYRKWSGMITRTTNKKEACYHSYGGRGIKVCDLWRNNFKAFYDWSCANGYVKGLTIDRIDNDGNYEPDNCQWITMKENSLKDRRSTFIMREKQEEICNLYLNKYITVTEISKRYKVAKEYISKILKLNNIEIGYRRMKKCYQ